MAEAAARRNERVGSQTASRNFVSNGNATAESAARATVASTRASQGKSAGHDFTVAKTSADGVLSTDYAVHNHTFVAAENSANMAFVTAVNAANVAYITGEAEAFRQRSVTTFTALDGHLIADDESFAESMHTLALANGSPWANYDDAVAAAKSVRSAAMLNADLALRIAGADADKLFAIVGAEADQSLNLSVDSAESALDLTNSEGYQVYVAAASSASLARANVQNFPAAYEALDRAQSLPVPITGERLPSRVATADVGDAQVTATPETVMTHMTTGGLATGVTFTAAVNGQNIRQRPVPRYTLDNLDSQSAPAETGTPGRITLSAEGVATHRYYADVKASPKKPATATPPPKPTTSLENGSVKINGKVWSRAELQKAYDEAIQRILKERAAQWEIGKYDIWGVYHATGNYVTTQESLMEQAKLMLGLQPDGMVRKNALYERLNKNTVVYLGRGATSFASVKFVALDGTEKIAVFQLISSSWYNLNDPMIYWKLVEVVDGGITTGQASNYAMLKYRSGLTAEAKRILFAVDMTQLALDIAGIFDPTPFSDVSSGLIALLKGEVGSAAISAVSIVPYVGDLSKVAKFRNGWRRSPGRSNILTKPAIWPTPWARCSSRGRTRCGRS